MGDSDLYAGLIRLYVLHHAAEHPDSGERIIQGRSQPFFPRFLGVPCVFTRRQPRRIGDPH